jgi:hypothetical protein
MSVRFQQFHIYKKKFHIGIGIYYRIEDFLHFIAFVMHFDIILVSRHFGILGWIIYRVIFVRIAKWYVHILIVRALFGLFIVWYGVDDGQRRNESDISTILYCCRYCTIFLMPHAAKNPIYKRNGEFVSWFWMDLNILTINN